MSNDNNGVDELSLRTDSVLAVVREFRAKLMARPESEQSAVLAHLVAEWAARRPRALRGSAIYFFTKVVLLLVREPSPNVGPKQ